MLLELKGPKDYQLGFEIKTVVANDTSSPLYFRTKPCMLYRSGFYVSTMEMLAGTYDVVPSTFKPGLEGPFILKVKSSTPFKLNRMK